MGVLVTGRGLLSAQYHLTEGSRNAGQWSRRQCGSWKLKSSRAGSLQMITREAGWGGRDRKGTQEL